MTRSQPDPSLAPFDSEIERTLLHIRQARRRLAFEGSEKEGTIYSSVDTTNSSSLDLGADTMAASRRVTLKEAGAPNFVLQPFHVLHSNLNTNFELKTVLINLLPKFYGFSAQNPIKHLKDFQGVCSTTKREGSDNYNFPFSYVIIISNMNFLYT
ncbi:hypothetical protein AHAS_Ahas02G0173600 [Arachis hypogaea]